MRPPIETWSRSSRVVKDYKFYFNIEDELRPIVTPIIFYNAEKSECITYEEFFRQKNHKNYAKLINTFRTYGGFNLELFKIKELSFYAGKGCIFRVETDNNGVITLHPIVIACFDENTNWKTFEKYKIIVSISELSLAHNKGLRPKLQKILLDYIENYKSDVIYTYNIMDWCFNPKPKLRFKSIKEQTEFLKNIEEKLVA